MHWESPYVEENFALQSYVCNPRLSSFFQSNVFILLILIGLRAKPVCFKTLWGYLQHNVKVFYHLNLPVNNFHLRTKCWFSRGNFTSLEYCLTYTLSKIFNQYWDLSSEVLCKDFPQWTWKLPGLKVKSSEKVTHC